MALCFALVLPLLLCLLGPALAVESGDAAREVDACQADIHRLCDKFFPDAKLVATCLVDRRAELSSGCAQLLAEPHDGDAPEGDKREGEKKEPSAQ